jgi:hypothetical protein
MQIDSEPNIRLASRQELEEVGALVADAFAPFRDVLPRHISDPT